ncbi:unnamed protein product [Mucor circinelloides]
MPVQYAQLFTSYGGDASWYESMYSETRMIMFPFFYDSFGNSLIMERSKLDVKRYRSLMQIHSRRAGAKRTEFIEEVAYKHKAGLLEHRQSADQRMGCFKSHDLDLYRALLTALACGE